MLPRERKHKRKDQLRNHLSIYYWQKKFEFKFQCKIFDRVMILSKLEETIKMSVMLVCMNLVYKMNERREYIMSRV